MRSKKAVDERQDTLTSKHDPDIVTHSDARGPRLMQRFMHIEGAGDESTSMDVSKGPSTAMDQMLG